MLLWCTTHARASVCASRCSHVLPQTCRTCGRYVQLQSNRTRLCITCRRAHDHPAPPAAAPSPPPPPPSLPAPLFDAHAGDHGRVPNVQRSSIVVLHKQGRTRQEIGQQAGVSQPTVRRWLMRYEESKDVVDAARSGRPRDTDEALDTAIAFTSHVEPFTPPRGIKRKLNLDISDDTIDRRLKEAGLYGRVARHLVTFTAEHKQKRTATRAGPKHSGRVYSSVMRPSSLVQASVVSGGCVVILAKRCSQRIQSIRSRIQ
jgi:transposase